VDDSTLPLTFVVTEKHDRDILGQVAVPLADLTSFRTNRVRRSPLQPCRKCPTAAGELHWEAWLSAGAVPAAASRDRVTSRDPATSRDPGEVTLSAGLRKLRDRLTAQQSPTLKRFRRHLPAYLFFFSKCFFFNFKSLTVPLLLL